MVSFEVAPQTEEASVQIPSLAPYRVVSLDHAPSSGAARLLGQGIVVNACSDVHSVVWEFRKAHKLSSDADFSERQAVIARYPLERAPIDERQPIERLSSPEVYGAMRQGGRIEPFYPPVDQELLRNLCAEIRAAFVWKAVTAG